MSAVIVWIQCIVGICTIAWGGYEDYKKREIPNMVPIILIISGLFSGNLPIRILSMLLVLIVLMMAGKITGKEVPGGDFKLICALTFVMGLFELLVILTLAGFGSVLVGLIGKKPLRRHIPLCTYVAPAYILLCSAKLF